MTPTKETLSRRVLVLERRGARNLRGMSVDELMSIVLGYPCKAADITEKELKDCVLTDEELEEIIDALR